MAATHIRMMHKALEQMNIKLQHVIADITGKSGQEIIMAILKGERDPTVLASLCDGRIKPEKNESIIKSLAGVWKDEHLFELEQSFEMYHLYRAKIKDCDHKIDELLCQKTNTKYVANKEPVAKSNKNNLDFDAKEMLKNITGIDLSEIFGITPTNSIEILSEIGLDMTKWPTAKHFTSWLNLAPNNKVSGGKILSSRIQKKKNHAGQVFKMAAFAIQRSKNWLAMFYHRIKAKAGTSKAIVATARKIAIIFYKMLKEKVCFEPIPIETYSQKFKDYQIRKIKNQAKALGLQLV